MCLLTYPFITEQGLALYMDPLALLLCRQAVLNVHVDGPEVTLVQVKLLPQHSCYNVKIGRSMDEHII
jgi:hypothetical protein